LKAAFLIIDGTCLLAVVLWLYSLFRLPFSWERLLGILVICAPVGVSLALRQGKSAMRLIFIPIGIMCAIGLYAMVWTFVFNMTYFLIMLTFAALPVLLYLPLSGRWFAAVREARGGQNGGCASCVAFFAFLILMLMLIALDLPSRSRCSRYALMTRDEFMAAASNEVNRVFQFMQGGTNFTVVVMGRMRLLASGPGVFVFNEDGIRVDRTIDYGDDLRFRERWGFTWADFRQTNSVSEKVSCEGKDGQHE
jgi:hypothetical protein